MRITAKKDSKYYKSGKLVPEVSAYLDGKKVKVVEADDDEGYVIVLKKDDDGLLIFLDSNNEPYRSFEFRNKIHEAIELLKELYTQESNNYYHIAKEKLYGKVKIKI